jgi:hypothetical protein
VFVAVFFHANLQKISGISIGVLCFIVQDGNLTKSNKGSFTTYLNQIKDWSPWTSLYILENIR